MSLMGLQESQITQFLEKNFGSEKFAPKLPFEELKKLFSKFQILFKQKGVKIISIAGTNGKGETAHTTHFLCRKEGIESLMWTSPHILSVRERFQSHAGPITESELWKQMVEATRELGDQLKCLSYYEFLFYVFCQWASELSPGVLILEVGVGGRLDAINVLGPSVCLLTSIGRDHVELLGDTYRAILMEKLGITRESVPLLSTLRSHYCRELVQQFVDEKQIPWMDLFNTWENFSSWPYFRRNHLLAFAGLHVLKHSAIDAKNLFQEFSNFERSFRFPTFQARREQMTLGDKSFIFVGAHNVEGMRELAFFLGKNKEDKTDGIGRVNDQGWDGCLSAKCVLVSFSKRPSSDIHYMLNQLLSIRSLEKIMVSSFEHAKAYIQNELKAIVMEYTEAQKRRATSVLKDCPGAGCVGTEEQERRRRPVLKDWSGAGCVGKGTTIDWCENWQHWIEKENQNTPVIVVGSYYFISKIQEFISQKN
ncbi:MAG: hypothetical protein A2X86_19890 [Bdellovibrionales bacterium GWA2_49_15]|nr:MAG: hypothetical protein A2X86_19890 [Bdellovibrionales bacterium GWA2_49_15]HAZ12522.1 hypothetical protein [Bdellovibrionales bacterium]